MTSKILITTAAVTVVSTMALAQMGQTGQQSTMDQPMQRSQPTAQPAGGAMQGQQSSQTGQSSQMTQAGQQQLTDREFVKQAASSGEYEVKSAKLVQDKVDDQQLKQHAMHIEQDHKKANDELKQIAKAKNITISDDMDARHQRMYDQLKDQDKEQLAQTWKQQQQQAHQDAIKLFQQASTQLQDPELKQFAQKQLPILQQHQAMLGGSDQSAKPAGAQLGEDQDLQKDKDTVKDKQPGYESKDTPINP